MISEVFCPGSNGRKNSATKWLVPGLANQPADQSTFHSSWSNRLRRSRHCQSRYRRRTYPGPKNTSGVNQIALRPKMIQNAVQDGKKYRIITDVTTFTPTNVAAKVIRISLAPAR
jgi:hypothetical protein